MEHIFEFCNKSIKTLSNLNNHKKTEKFCLNLQKESKPNEIIIPILKCDYCQKEVSTKFILNNHLNVCSLKILYNKLEEQKLELEKKYNEQLKEKDSAIILLTKTQKNSDDQLNKKSKLLKEKEEECNKKNSLINEKEQKILLLTQSLEFKDILIKEKDNIIKEKEQFIQDNFKELIYKKLFYIENLIVINTTVNIFQ